MTPDPPILLLKAQSPCEEDLEQSRCVLVGAFVVPGGWNALRYHLSEPT